MRDLVCGILHQIDEAWLDHGEAITSTKLLAREVKYENFLFSMEANALNIHDKFADKLERYNYTFHKIVVSTDFHPDSNVAIITNIIFLLQREEEKLENHRRSVIRSMATIEHSMSLLRKASKTLHVTYVR
jgi:hypothetical protein